MTPAAIPAVAFAATLAAGPALAHHPLGGAPMSTFAHGLLSGVGHPLLGFDHLFFVVAVGVAAAFTGRRLLAPLAFVAAMLAGVGLRAGGFGPPFVEPVVALSLLIVGGLVALGRRLSFTVATALFVALGLFHGLAFGGAIAGQEGRAGADVLAGYLLGLGAAQWAIAVAAGFAVTGLLGAKGPGDTNARLTGAAVAGAGLLLTLQAVEAGAFAALGLG